jgi:hypothetical protein
MKEALASIAAFAKLLEWRCFRSVNAAKEVHVDAPRVHVFACRDEHQAVVWLLRGHEQTVHSGLMPPRTSMENVRVTVRGLMPGAYNVEQWNTLEGRSLGCLDAHVGSDHMLQVTVPALANDLALAVRREAALISIEKESSGT